MLTVAVLPANIQDRDAADEVVARGVKKHPTLKKVYVDMGYSGKCEKRLEKRFPGVDVEVVPRMSKRRAWQGPQLALFKPVPVFQVLRKRWVVERTNSWSDRPRRLGKDHEQRIDVAEAWVWFAHASLLMRRVAAAPKLPPRPKSAPSPFRRASIDRGANL